MKANSPRRPALFGLATPIAHPVYWRPRGRYLMWAVTILLVLFGSPTHLQAAYTPYYSDFFYSTSIDTTKWYQNGSVSGFGGGGTNQYGLWGDGSLISKLTAPTPSTDYDVEMGVRIIGNVNGDNGGTFVQYLRATNDAVSGPTPSGSYYAVELQNTTFPSYYTKYGTATLAVYKRVSGVITQLGSTVVPVAREVDGVYQAATRMRSVIRGQQISVYVNGIRYFSLTDSSLTSGQPGVGVRGSYVQPANLGPIDTVPPPAINAQSVATSEFPTQVDFQWQAASDDANGVGVAYYQIQRNGGSLQTLTTPEFSDASVTAATSYTYTLYAVDFHQNVSSGTPINVTTPPAGAVDPRRVGVRPTGSYWGAQGEQLDTLSGNLNFSLPLLTARGRTGWTVPAGLSYNSQLWRQDPGGTWKLGRDVGYGFGWKLQAGSITPYWSDPFTIHHYTFTDGSGAEYRLDVNTSGVWTSREGIYLSYDPNTYRLYFPSGMFWTMGSVSAGTEQDAGTRYPTTIQDSNGNQIFFNYKAAVGSSWVNSSARIWRINDVRGLGTQTYEFTYNTDAIPHLTSVTNGIATAEKYTLTYLTNQPLNSPFGAVSFGTTTLLQNVTVTGLGLGHTFEYAASGSGELTKVTLPYGGALRWAYQSFTFTGNRTIREVANRYLTKAVGATETNYAFGHDPGDSARTVHALTTLDDPSGVGEKAWLFTTTGTWQVGLVSSYEERGGAGQAAIQKKDFTWTQDAAGNPYTSAILTTLDPGQSYQKQSKIEQTVNVYGSVTQSKIYDYGSLVTPARTYTHTYLTGTNYSSRYINNRLTTSQVSDGTQTITLVTNTYDGAYPQTPLGVLYGNHDTANYGTSLLYRGNVTRRTQQGAYVDFRYDYTGTTKTATDNLGYNVTVTPADYSNNDVPGVITPNSNTNLNTRLTYATFFGVTSKTDPNVSTSTLSYDGYARPQSSTSPHGAGTGYTYTNSPPTVKATTSGRWVKTTMDGLGRAIKVETADSTNTVYSVVDTEYDSCACSPLGKVKRVSQPYAPEATVYWTTNTYDALGRTVSVSLPGGTGTTTYLYQGNTTKVTDPAGKWKTYTTDALGNLTKVTEPNPAGGTDLDTNYTYNLFNRLTQTSMTRSSTTQTRTFNYDSTTQRLTSVTHPESGSVTYTYNADGTVATKVDAKNQKIAYTYDSYKRVTQIQRYPVSTGAENVCERAYFWYDTDKHDPSNVYGFQLQNGWGRLTSVEWYVSPSPACTSSDQSNGTRIVERYSYTSGGLVTKKRLHPMNVNTTWPNEAGGLVSSTSYMEAVYTYNNEGQMVSMKYPGDTQTSGPGRTYTYSFDSLSRPSKLTDDQATPIDWVKNVLYAPSGQMTQMLFTLFPNIYYTETRTYNARAQLTQISTTGGWPGLNMQLQYNYSATQNNGQITQAVDSLSGETVDYAYDTLNRLITAATTGPQWGLSFGYDGFGNRLSQTVTKGSAPASSLSVNASTNRISSSGYGYDSNGNLTTTPYGAGSMTLTYDIENRLIQAANSNGTEQYGYSPDNRRVYQKLPSGSGGSQFIYFYGVNGDRLRKYTYYGNGVFQVAKTDLYFAGRLLAVMDRLGSVRGNKYLPYGEELPATTNDQDKFATYFRDSSTGLDYAMNRYYGSNMGRFLTPDPFGGSAEAGNPQSWNRYAYVNNDPINQNDPSGLAPGDIVVDVVGRYPPSGDPYLAGFLMRGPWSHGMKILDRSDRADVEDARRIFREDLESALSKAIKALEKDQCRALFHGADPSEVLTSIVEGRRYGEVKAKLLKPEAAAQTGRKWWNPLEVRIDISMREGDGYWLNLDEEGRGFLLLHELGHVFHRLFDGSDLKDNDTGDSAEAEKNRKINDKLLSDNCIGRQL